ncbi:hypothetical protein DFH29DRAFT_870319 [Suillus ampliporus]|nr:hypothetical protein DFH29DRAFT_870319 [Suillus ampliporus]
MSAIGSVLSGYFQRHRIISSTPPSSPPGQLGNPMSVASTSRSLEELVEPLDEVCGRMRWIVRGGDDDSSGDEDEMTVEERGALCSVADIAGGTDCEDLDLGVEKIELRQSPWKWKYKNVSRISRLADICCGVTGEFLTIFLDWSLSTSQNNLDSYTLLSCGDLWVQSSHKRRLTLGNLA